MHWAPDADLVGCLDFVLPALVLWEWLLLRFLHASHPTSVFLQGMEGFSCVPGQGRCCALVGAVLWGDPQLEPAARSPRGCFVPPCCRAGAAGASFQGCAPLEINDGANNTLPDPVVQIRFDSALRPQDARREAVLCRGGAG